MAASLIPGGPGLVAIDDVINMLNALVASDLDVTGSSTITELITALTVQRDLE